MNHPHYFYTELLSFFLLLLRTAETINSFVASFVETFGHAAFPRVRKSKDCSPLRFRLKAREI
jgi:hypothetical protein